MNATRAARWQRFLERNRGAMDPVVWEAMRAAVEASRAAAVEVAAWWKFRAALRESQAHHAVRHVNVR